MSVRVEIAGQIGPGSILRLTGVEDDPEAPLSAVLQQVIEACRAAAGHDRFVIVAGEMSLEPDTSQAAAIVEMLGAHLADPRTGRAVYGGLSRAIDLIRSRFGLPEEEPAAGLPNTVG